MAEVIGLAASITSLIQISAEVASVTYCYIQGVRNASSDIKDLLESTKHLSGVLSALQVYTRTTDDDLDDDETTFGKLEEPLNDCRKILEQLLESLEGSTAKSGARRVLKSLTWPLKSKETLRYQERLRWYISLFDLALSSDTHEVIRKLEEYSKLGWQRVDDIYEIVQKIHVNSENALLDSFSEGMIDWISTVDFDANHRQACSLQQEGTGKWLSEGQQFQGWLASVPSTPFIWLSGMPGAGKTILMSTLVQSAMEKSVTAVDAVAFYYFDFKVSEKQTAEGFLRSVLKQLVLQSPHVPAEMTAMYNKYRYSRKSVPFEEWKNVFRIVAAGFHSISILVDAMDESTEWDKLSLLLLWLTSSSLSNLKLLASSRRKKHISDCLGSSQFIEVAIQNEQVDRDIEAHVSEVLKTSKFSRFPTPLKELIARKLSEGSKGMFRWAKCQIDSLSKCQTPRAVKTVLDMLPPTLDETYERIIEEIDESQSELARRALLWLILSKRDLKLHELAEAVIIEPDVFELDPDSRLLDPSVILEVCGSLVTLQRTGVIGLAHYSVKEYFMSGRATLLKVELLAAEAELARSCLTYLLLDELEQGPAAPRDLYPKFEELSFLSYASSHWWKHAVLNEEANLDLTVKFLTPKRSTRAEKLLAIYFEEADPNAYYNFRDKGKLGGKSVKSLHLAAAYNLVKTAEILCTEHAIDLNLRADIYGSPLYLAAENGHEQMVDVLIRHGADLNMGRGFYGTTLSAACISGKLEIVRKLVEAGADVNGTSAKSRYNHPLIAATAWAGLDTVRYLVEHGSNINATNSRYMSVSGSASPLNAASNVADWDVVEYILSQKPKFDLSETLSDIVTSRKYGIERALRLVLDSTPHTAQDLTQAFLWAAYDGRCDLAEILLRYGADVNLMYGFMDDEKETPLQRAAQNGRLEMVQFLLRHGAEVDKSDKKTNTPLQLAAYSGWDLEVFNALLEAGADVNAPSGKYGSALHCAASATFDSFRVKDLPYKDVSLDIFLQLLDHGAEIDPAVPDYLHNDSETPLIAAAEQGRIEMVEALIKRGVDVNRVATQGYYVTALCAAARYGEYEIVKLLLEAGADPNIVGLNYGTALNAAAKALCPARDYFPYNFVPPRAGEVFKMILDSGADLDINHETSPSVNLDSYDTPLVTAAYNKHWEAVNLLLDHGVSISGYNTRAMYGAAKGGNLQVLRRMYDLGGDPGTFEYQSNLLQVATENANCPVELVEYLISKGVSVNARRNSNPFYDSPLDGAARNRRLDLVKLICEHNPETEEWRHWRVCSIAISFRQWEMEKVLRDHGFVPEDEAPASGSDGAEPEHQTDNEEWEADESKADWYNSHEEADTDDESGDDEDEGQDDAKDEDDTSA